MDWQARYIQTPQGWTWDLSRDRVSFGADRCWPTLEQATKAAQVAIAQEKATDEWFERQYAREQTALIARYIRSPISVSPPAEPKQPTLKRQTTTSRKVRNARAPQHGRVLHGDKARWQALNYLGERD